MGSRELFSDPENTKLENPWLFNDPPKSNIYPQLQCTLKQFKDIKRETHCGSDYPYLLDPENESRISYHEFRGYGIPPDDVGYPSDVYWDMTPNPFLLYIRHNTSWVCWNPISSLQKSICLPRHPLLKNRFLWSGKTGTSIGFMWLTKKHLYRNKEINPQTCHPPSDMFENMIVPSIPITAANRVRKEVEIERRRLEMLQLEHGLNTPASLKRKREDSPDETVLHVGLISTALDGNASVSNDMIPARPQSISPLLTASPSPESDAMPGSRLIGATVSQSSQAGSSLGSTISAAAITIQKYIDENEAARALAEDRVVELEKEIEKLSALRNKDAAHIKELENLLERAEGQRESAFAAHSTATDEIISLQNRIEGYRLALQSAAATALHDSGEIKKKYNKLKDDMQDLLSRQSG